jgi:hypothetical protein
MIVVHQKVMWCGMVAKHPAKGIPQTIKLIRNPSLILIHYYFFLPPETL